VLAFNADDTPKKTATSERVFCSECSAALWNYHPEYPDVSEGGGADGTEAKRRG
jgi:hypothetical protein